MREGFLFPGVVLLVLMVLFVFVPLPYPAQGTVSNNSALRVGPPSFPYSASTPISISWSGGQGNTWLQVVPCHQGNCGDIKAIIGNNPTNTPVPVSGWEVFGYGGSGAFTVWVPTNQSLMIVTNLPAQLSITVTWDEMPEFSLFWEILTVVGVLLAVGGIVLPEAGAPRGHHRRLHYGHWRHHAFALPPHLPSEGLICPACGLADIPHEDDYCPRCHAPLPRTSSTMSVPPAGAATTASAASSEVVSQGPPPTGAAAAASVASPGPSGAGDGALADAAVPGGAAAAAVAASIAAQSGPSATPPAAAPEAAPAKKRTAVNRSKVVGQSLSVADPDPMKPWRVVKGLGFAPAEVLIFTREDPEVLQTRYNLDPSLIYVVTRSEGEHAISPGQGDTIADMAEQHLRTHKGGAVVLTDPNYIVTHVGFDSLQRLSHALQDHARDQRGTFILAFNPQVLSPEQKAHLEERMRKVL